MQTIYLNFLKTAAFVTVLIANSVITFGQSFTQDFEVPASLTDWFIRNNSDTIASATLAANWGFGNSTNFPAQAGTAGSYVAVGFQSSNNTTSGATLSNWLFTPSRTMNNGDIITFYTRTATVPQFADRLEVRMSKAGAGLNVGTTSASVGDFTTLLLTVNPNLTLIGYPSGWTQYTITISGLTGPTLGRVAFRYFVTNGGPAGANSDYIGIDTYSYTSTSSAPANDNCAGATTITHGATCTPTTGNVAFATQSQAGCSGTANDDVWFKFTATSTSAIVTVAGSTDFDGVFEVFSGTCGALTSLGCIDNTLEGDIETSSFNNLVIGQVYHIRVYDWYSAVPASTTFTICVEQFIQCTLTAPAGSIPETETCGQDLNGGCNATVPAYQPISCGQTVAGSAWATGGNRDTDWYQFTLSTPGTVTWTAEAEFPFLLFLVDISNCASPGVIASNSFPACQSGTISFNIATAGTYAAFISPSVFEGYACATNNDYFATLTLPSETPTITAAGPTTFCPGGSVVLNASGTGTHEWFNGATSVGTGASYTASTVGDYTVKFTNNNGCPATSTTTTVALSPLDDATFAYASNTICIGSANSTPTTTVTGVFSSTPVGLDFVSTSTGEIDMSTTVVGVYTITYTTNAGCSNTSSQTVTITTSPEAGFEYANASYCASGGSILPTFDAGASGGTFSVTPAGLTLDPASGSINLNTSNAGTYVVTNTIAAAGACAASSDNTTITINAIPTAVITGNGVICNAVGETNSTTLTIALSGNGPWDFTYSDGTTPTTVTGHATSTYSFTTSTAGTYTVVSVEDANCSNVGSGSVSVSVNANPTVTLSGIPTICANSTANALTQGLPAGGTYSGPGVTGSSFNPTGLSTGTIVQYAFTDGLGCSGTASASITIEDAPTVTIAPVTQTLCANTTPVTLTATPAGGSFSGPGITPNGVFTPSQAGVGSHVITYTANSAGGCSASGTITVQVESCASLIESNLLSIHLIPNPTDGLIELNYDETLLTIKQVTVHSIEGRRIGVISLAPGSNIVSVESLPAGMYVMNIETNLGIVSERFIKK